MANGEISKLSESVDELNGKLERIAEFFCEDKQKFSVEELLIRLVKFLEHLPTLVKVWYVTSYCEACWCVSLLIYRKILSES